MDVLSMPMAEDRVPIYYNTKCSTLALADAWLDAALTLHVVAACSDF